jgi:type IV pilus assembly protein PilB
MIYTFLVRRQTMGKLLGQVLMESGMITIDELNEAIEIQKSSGQKLGDILISLNMITNEELNMALEFQDDEQE